MAPRITSSSEPLPGVSGYVTEVRSEHGQPVRVVIEFNAGRDRYGHAHRGGFSVEYVFDISADGVDIDPLPVSATVNYHGGIRPSELNRFAWTRWAAVAEAHARLSSRYTVQRLTDLTATHTAVDRDLGIAVQGRPGRRGNPPDFYPSVADRYRALCSDGLGKPVERLARERTVSRATAAGWVREARARGYLPPARKGRAG
jgi:hypothetical protein